VRADVDADREDLRASGGWHASHDVVEHACLERAQVATDRIDERDEYVPAAERRDRDPTTCRPRSTNSGPGNFPNAT